MTAKAKTNILKVSERLTAELKKRDSPQEARMSCKNDSELVYRPKSKKYLKPERVIKPMGITTNKENYEHRLKALKKEKIKHYRS
jgi:hypothetical protein